MKAIGASAAAAVFATTLTAALAHADDDFTHVWALFSQEGSGLSVEGYRGTTSLLNPDDYSDVADAGTGLPAFFDIERLKGFTAASTTFTMADYQNEGDKTLWNFGESWVIPGFIRGNHRTF